MKDMLKAFWAWFYSNFKKPKYYVSICCIQKDENEYLLEWIDYHLKIGVDHFFIYDNGSKISPKLILENYISNGVITLIDYPGQGRQNDAYMECIKQNMLTSKWIACIDIDEFIVPKIPYGDLKGFLRNFESYAGVGLNWLLFGSNGHKKRTNKSQLESFTMRSKSDFDVNKHIKSIVQPKYVRKKGTAHHFKYFCKKYCVNENFEPIDGPFSKHSSSKIQLNHYYCRSEEEYLDKITRGYADHIGSNRDISQFTAHDIDSNDVEDLVALNIKNRVK